MTFELVTRNALRNSQIAPILIAVCSIAGTALADIQTSVAYNFGGSTRITQRSPRPTLIGPVSDSDADISHVGAKVFLKPPTIGNQVTGEGATSVAAIKVFAGATVGQFKLRAAGSVQQSYTFNAPVGEAFLNGSMQAYWQDTIRLSAANTTKAHLHGTIDLHGSVGAGVVALPANLVPNTNWAAAAIGFGLSMKAGLEQPLPDDIPTNFGTYYAAMRETTAPAQVRFEYPVPASIPFDIVVGVGETYPLEVFASLRIESSAKSDNYVHDFPGTLTALFAGELSNTISWGGIDSVTDAITGAPIENWTITSESGFDYSRPFRAVPEPSAGAQLGVLLLLATARPRILQ